MRPKLRRPTNLKAYAVPRQYARKQSHFANNQLLTPQVAQRQLRSAFWIPQATLLEQDAEIDVGQLLVRAGYFRQAYSGIFHMLPLGLRVQSKIEALVDKHMQSLQASKVALSSITSQKLWERSGRLKTGSEFFKFKDRKRNEWLLAPTHEEEITNLVKDVIHAPRHLPIRLYQISRKYRDEKRPRGGLLRGREFIMKDLYTFDKTETDAHNTYALVGAAYCNLFDELRLPYVVARADSGNMGGNLSHEFHFPSSLGEDDIITCSECDYAKNEEFVPPFTAEIKLLRDTVVPRSSLTPKDQTHNDAGKTLSRHFLSKDQQSLIVAHVDMAPGTDAGSMVNPYAVKECLQSEVEVDTGIEDEDARSALSDFGPNFKVYHVFDQTVTDDEAHQKAAQLSGSKLYPSAKTYVTRIIDPDTKQSHLLRKRDGDACPQCESAGKAGKLVVRKAIEVAHTFHLGERYSSKLELRVPADPKAFVSMGCHGIGVSRLIAAAASIKKNGLLWPRAIAPFEVLIVINTKNSDFSDTIEVGNQIYDNLSNHDSGPADVLIDDRSEFDFGWKLQDADLIGYPVVAVLGKRWKRDQLVELQCSKLGLKEFCSLEDAPGRVREWLAQL